MSKNFALKNAFSHREKCFSGRSKFKNQNNMKKSYLTSFISLTK